MMENHPDILPSLDQSRDVKAGGKSLRKAKSLTRLFTSSRRLSRSRPPSIEDIPTPPTPTIPVHFLPSSPTASPPSTTSPSAHTASRIWPSGGSQKDVRNNLQKLGLVVSKDDTFLQPRRSWRRKKSAEEPIHALETSRSIDTNEQRVLLGPQRHTEYVEKKAPVNQSSPFPTFRKRPKGAPKQAHDAVTIRRRGFSSSTVKSVAPSSRSAIPPRPSTAGGETSKRMRSRDGPSQWFHESDEDVSIAHKAVFSRTPPRPWQGRNNNATARSSFRSASTTNSSTGLPTERSSVATKGTSATDPMVDSPLIPFAKDDGLTVEDTISLYAKGFEDDEEPPPKSRRSSANDEEKRRSAQIAEAISNTIGSISPSATRSSLSELPVVVAAAELASSNEPGRPPPILPPTSTRDQYGFLKTSFRITNVNYDAWNTQYAQTQERRSIKWVYYMRDQHLPTYLPERFPSRSTKTQRFIHKGIPPPWRGSAWFYYAGGPAQLASNPSLYPSLVARSASDLSTEDKELIDKDLHRTFPENIHFKPDPPLNPHAAPTPELPLLSSLRRLLQAFALHNPRIGYCQSLNFLAALLLLFLPEDKAFILLDIITTSYLPGTHDLSLEGANVDLWVLMTALKDTHPAIWSRLGAPDDMQAAGAKLPSISLCTTSWFMSLFIGTLPIESVLRIWDILFYEGSRTLFRVALTIFKLGEQNIKDVSDPGEMFQAVQSFPRGLLDVGGLMKGVCKRGGLTQEWVDKKRNERREWYAAERARLSGAFAVGATTKSRTAAATPSRSKTGTAWKRRTRVPEVKGVLGV